LYDDALTQGPKIFASKCASCHAYDGHDGTGTERSDEQVASDLHGFGSRGWVAAILDPERVDHIDHLGWTIDVTREKMIDFVMEDLFGVEEDEEPDPEDVEKVAKVVKALSAEAHLTSQQSMDLAEADAIAEGRELIGESGFDCTSCHKFYDEGSRGPELTNYASRNWMIEFIKDPQHKRFYGPKLDKMPVFGSKQEEDGSVRSAILSDREIEMVVDWIRGDWDEKGEDPADRQLAAQADADRWAAALKADAERELAEDIEDAVEEAVDEANEVAEEAAEKLKGEAEAAMEKVKQAEAVAAEAKAAAEKAEAAAEKAAAEKAAAEKAAAEKAAEEKAAEEEAAPAVPEPDGTGEGDGDD
ncbi:MAG: hypothetical protein ACR2RV_28960, partial [Verrucomicrobiales bacterium]